MESSPKEEGLSPEESIKKCCSDCKTTKTPLWRSGPAGPKSLCNACGIRQRKKRPLSDVATGGDDDKNDVKKGKMGKKKKMKLRNGLKVNNMMMVLERIRSPRQWGEVERAALLLMALSCGAVFT
ncbi:hypothetical protein CASFOL_035567 [Castilleja foliolosa]|uniref:GATA-type domain-containing protein n=1 Tax=Castilleja foliolosa TaxID=1961234 RepID=A0ABD3BT05_9LAMI